MKISDGNWLIQKNLQVINPICFFEAEKKADELRVHVAPKNVAERKNQVDVPLFTYTFSTRQTDTICVRIEHFRGNYVKVPKFHLHNDPEAKLSFTEDEEKIWLRSGKMLVCLYKKGEWQMDFFYEGRKLTSSGVKSAGYARNIETQTPYMYEQLGLQVGELVYGLGERFTSFVKNGQNVELWNLDGGTSTEQAYKNVPFYMTNRSYGVFIEQPDKVSLEVASEKVSQVQFSVKGESLTYHIIGGTNLKEVLSGYTAMTGRIPRLPAWSFGLWLSTSFTTDYDEKTVTSFIDGMQERCLPIHVFHFDCFWMKALHWCDFIWDEKVFPQPKEMLARLKARGLKICVWLNPYISQQSRLFDEGMQRHYFIETKDGCVWQQDRWQAGMAVIDFTNPEACAWYTGYLAQLLDMGVDCFKTDFGEFVPTEVKYADGSDPEKMHNYYTYLYNKTVFDLLQKKRGEGEAVLFARSATAGSQSFPVHWGGDCHGTYESMAETLRGGLSLGLSGFSFWSHDIGGFENTSPADVYKRWCAFGLLSSHSRLHGSKSYRVPWAYDGEAVDVLRYFTQWKCRLMPYLYQLAEIAHETGVPLMRAMLLEFQEDPACEYLDRQYMLGDSLLVAPVMQEDGAVTYYLPAGTWTHLFTGKSVVGNCWLKETYDFMSLPIFVRENTILALGNNQERPDYDYLDQVTFYLAHLNDKAAAHTKVTALERDYAVEAEARREGSRYVLRFTGLKKSCSILLPSGRYRLLQGTARPDGDDSCKWCIAPDTAELIFEKVQNEK
jgi:alpha-D-xyloside xylohydrolase